jgi:hypothetical protein
MGYTICIPCKRRMTAFRNGISVIEYFDISHKEAYKIWSAELFQCDECGARAVGGFSPRPYAEQFHQNFDEQLKAAIEKEFTVAFH